MCRGLVFTLTAGIVLFVYAVLYRHDHSEFELKNYELFFIIVPMLVYGFVTCKISVLELFGIAIGCRPQLIAVIGLRVFGDR